MTNCIRNQLRFALVATLVSLTGCTAQRHVTHAAKTHSTQDSVFNALTASKSLLIDLDSVGIRLLEFSTLGSESIPPFTLRTATIVRNRGKIDIGCDSSSAQTFVSKIQENRQNDTQFNETATGGDNIILSIMAGLILIFISFFALKKLNIL